MKLLNKILARLFFGGYELQIGFKTYLPIHKTAPYFIAIIFSMLYFVLKEDTIGTENLGLWQMGTALKILISMFVFLLYVIFIHFHFFPVKFADLNKFQKWQYGMGIIHGPALVNTMTPAEWQEWKLLDKQIKE